jgi:dipeptidyl aminopeptidase/acylaminoacyl peptidase
MKLFLCCIAIVLVGANLPNLWAQSRPFTVADDITMERFTEPSAAEGSPNASFSPDGKHFAIVTSKGILQSDEIESTLTVFNSGEVRAFLSGGSERIPPLRRVHFSLSATLSREQDPTYASTIMDLRWSADSKYLYFIGESSGDRRLYRWKVAAGMPVTLTDPGMSVVRFTVGTNEFVYSAWSSKRSAVAVGDTGAINADARSVTGGSIRHILFPEMDPRPTRRRLWVFRDQGISHLTKPIPAPSEVDVNLGREAFSLSPDGKFLIRVRPVTVIAQDWSQYLPVPGFEYLKIEPGKLNSIAPDNLLRLREYSLLDIKTGVEIPLISAPVAFALAYGGDSTAVWSSNGKQILLTNSFLPLNNVDPADAVKRQSPCSLVAVQLTSRSVTCVVYAKELGEGHILGSTITFTEDSNAFSFAVSRGKGGEEHKAYIRENGVYRPANVADLRQEASKASLENHSLRVFVKQSLNGLPTLWATDAATMQTKQLWDPNPQLTRLEFGKASIFRWRDHTGHDWEGGLVLPVGYTAGKRYPLVIQIYNFDATRFMTDGLFPTAMAARALASDGIVVLQMQRRFPHTFDDSEAQAHIEAFSSATDTLSRQGLIDPHRVGLVGFSATSWYVEEALIQDPDRYAAATIAEGIDISYMQYCLWGTSNPALAGEFEKFIGSKPLGKGLSLWVEKAPGFHLDRVETPLRIEAMQPASILGEWELYSSLERQGKPVDLIYFPKGDHVHQRPLERLASQQGDVDWFRFWLQGYEDPAPSKKEQYLRWEAMRTTVALKSEESK